MQFVIDKDLKLITIEDLKTLILNKKQEDTFLDFKRDMYGKSDGDKKELLKDVSAFANGSGGEIIIGIEEDNFSQAKSLYGFESSNIAVDKNRIEQIIMNGLEPKLDTFKVRYIHLVDNRYIMIIRIEHSNLYPHMVSYQRFNKFYMRKSDKNILLDVYELRNLFLKSENFMQEIRKYNQDKIDEIVSGNTIVPTIKGPKILVNFIPFDAFTRRNFIELAKAEIKLNFPEQRINFDGLLAYQMNDKGINSYCQVYRNGIIEFLSSSSKVFDEVDNPFNIVNKPEDSKMKVIYGGKTGYEYYLIRKSYEMLKILRKFRVSLPVYVFVSIIDAKGYRILYYDSAGNKKITDAIDRDILSLPEIELKDYTSDIKEKERLIFNLIWNSCGERQSINFGRDGEWMGEEFDRKSEFV